jgi:chromosome segregation protein
MYLKSLEISGFKSFGKKSELIFDVPIVGIVGPNGSGKSNVAEAFRFVLGEQSMKSMRGKRGEDLIFNGGKSAAKQNRAGVKLTFDNRPIHRGKRLFTIDYDEVTLERVVYRDGVNEYLINGSQVRLKDIMELLAGANIGASGHHIISQGEADRILNASIKERRAMIEDALGLKVFQYKKQESERKLLKTAENIKQVESLRKEIAPHIRFLEKQVEKIKKAEDLKNDLRTLYHEYLKREETYLASEKKQIESDRNPIHHALTEIDRKIAHIKEVLEREKEQDRKTKELIEVEEGLREAERLWEQGKQELSRMEGTLQAEERALARADQASKHDESFTVSYKEVERLGSEIRRIAGEAEAVTDLSGLRGLLQKVRELFDGFVSLHHTARPQSQAVGDIEKEISMLKERKSVLEHDTKEKEKEAHIWRERYQKLKTSIEKETKEGREAEREMFALLNERNEKANLLARLEGRIELLRRDDTSFKLELEEAQALLGLDALRYSQVAVDPHEARPVQEERRKKLERLKVRLEEAGGAGGSEVLKEFDEVTTRDQFLAKELLDLHQSSETLTTLVKELEEKLNIEFKAGIEKINSEFEQYFTLMFGGGHASLSVIRPEKKSKKKDTDLDLGDEDFEMVPEEEAEEGIEIAVSLPHKRIKGLVMLSGGERALTSIALLFAISQVNPPPFVILDETDAALDEANSKKYGDMVENLAKNSQLILITHNRETMSRAGILYGVTMGSDGVSKLLSVRFEEALAVAK